MRLSGFFAEVPLAIVFVAATYGFPMVIGANTSMTAITVLAVSVILICVCAALIIGPTFFLTYWVLLAIMQNLAVGIWHVDSTDEIPLVVTEAKTLAAFVACIVNVRAIFQYLSRNTRFRWAVTAYVLVILIHVRGFDPASIAYLRNFLVPISIAILTAALTSSFSRNQRILFLSRIASTVAILGLIGSLIELFTGTSQWRRFVNAESSGALSSLSTYTNFLGIPFERIGGIFVEPTNAGYVASIAVLVMILLSGQLRVGAGLSRVDVIGMGAGVTVIFLSAAKNGLLLLAVAVLCILLFRSKLTNKAAFMVSWLASFVVTTFYIIISKGFGPVISSFTNPIKIVGGESTTFHFAGLIYGITAGLTGVVGHGIGQGGNFNRTEGQSRLAWLSTGSESAWGVLAYQTGLLGIAAWLIVLIVAGSMWGKLSAVMLSAWSASAMFAEAVIGPQIAGLAMMSAALLAGVVIRGSTNTVPSRPVPKTRILRSG